MSLDPCMGHPCRSKVYRHCRFEDGRSMVDHSFRISAIDFMQTSRSQSNPSLDRDSRWIAHVPSLTLIFGGMESEELRWSILRGPETVCSLAWSINSLVTHGVQTVLLTVVGCLRPRIRLQESVAVKLNQSSGHHLRGR